jgi:3-oxoadipate enol-lactonase
MEFIAIRDTVLCVEAEPVPARPTIVFSNSLGTDYRSWDAVAARLRGRFGLVRYDKRGHGLSLHGAAANSIDIHAEDLLALLAHLKLDNTILCGLSVGGMIAQSVGARKPAGVRGLVLCDTAHRIGTADIWNTRIAAIRAGGMAAIADGVMQRWFSPAFIQRGGAPLAGWRTLLERCDPAGYIAVCEAIRDADLEAATRTITLPAMVLCGDQDAATPPDLVRSMAALIPGASFDLLPGCGHLPCVEQADLTASHIIRFAEGLRP